MLLLCLWDFGQFLDMHSFEYIFTRNTIYLCCEGRHKMYFREKKTKNSTLLQLVRGDRGQDGKVRQKVILSLGGVNIPVAFRREVAAHVENIINGQTGLWPLKPKVAAWVDLVVDRLEAEGKINLATQKIVRKPLPDGQVADNVILDDITHERSTQIGVLLPPERAWECLGLSDFLIDKGVSPRHIRTAKAIVFNRLVEPCSENEVPSWARVVALDELLGDAVSRYGRDTFYRAGDSLFAHCDEMEKHLRQREADLFGFGNTILLYDLTNSYFEGKCTINPKAKRSVNSKENRTDCPLLSLGLVLNVQGFPIVHKVFAGNICDSKTLLDIVKSLHEASGIPTRPTVVLDSGIATKDNLAALLENNYDYLVNGKRITRQNFADDFASVDDFEVVGGRDDKKPVYVKKILQGDEVLLLCRSEDRKAKEDAMVSKVEERYLDALAKLAGRIAKNDARLRLGNEKDGPAQVNRCIGKIASRYTRASKFYTVSYDSKERKLSWVRDDDEYRESGELHDCYYLRTSRLDLPDDDIWLTYIMLTRVEAAFRLLKGDLGLRPIYHRKEERCDTHIWITVLAYHLLRWIEYSLELAGMGMTYQAMRRILQTHCYTTILVPCKDGRMYSIRRAGRPDERQKSIYQALGIDLNSLPVRKEVIEPVIANGQ